MNGIIVLIGYGLLAYIIGKMVFPSKGGKFGMLFQGGNNNFLSAGKTEEKVKTYDNKPAAQDPTVSQNQGKNDEDAQLDPGNTRIHSYADFNPDYMDNTEGSLNINLGENVIDRITLSGNGLNKNILDLKEKEEIIDAPDFEISDAEQSEIQGSTNGYLPLENGSEEKQAVDSSIKEVENTALITGYSNYVPNLREIKGPVKTMLIEKFTPPEGFKVEMLMAPEGFNVENLIANTQNIQNPDEEQQVVDNDNKEKTRKISQPKLVPDINMPKDPMIENNVLDENNDTIKMINPEAFLEPEDIEENLLEESKDNKEKELEEGNIDKKEEVKEKNEKITDKVDINETVEVEAKEEEKKQHEDKRKRHFTGNNQLEIMNSIGNDLNNPENQMLSHPQIIKMNQLTRQLLEEDKNLILSQDGHQTYLNRAEINDLKEKEDMYASIYRISQQFGIEGNDNKKSIRDIANKVVMFKKQREEKASKEASKEVENKIPEINKEAFRKILSDDYVKVNEFIRYMDQFMDLKNIELSEKEKQKYREQAKKNIEERANLSLESIEEEYNRLYQKAKEEKTLDKVFSNDSKQMNEIVSDIINVPEIGTAVFGEKEYQKMLNDIDRISDAECRQLYNKIKENLMSELTGKENMKDEEEDKKEKRNRTRTENRAAYREYVQRKNMMKDTNSDIMKALGVEIGNGENSEVIVPIKTYTPNVIDSQKRDDVKAV